MLLMLGGSGAGKGTFLRATNSACFSVLWFPWKCLSKVMKQHGMDVDNFVLHGLDEWDSQFAVRVTCQVY